jgi:hypothetical protein
LFPWAGSEEGAGALGPKPRFRFKFRLGAAGITGRELLRAKWELKAHL